MDAELTTFATAAQSSLSTLWTGAGIPQSEQDESIKRLVASLREVVDGTVKAEEAKLTAMRDGMPGLREELTALREQLGGDVRAVPQADGELLLAPQHRALSGAIQAATGLRAERLEQRKAKEERLESIRLEIDGEDGPAPDAPEAVVEPACDAAGGLSLALLGRLQARVDALNDEKAARLATVGGITSEADGLRKTLGYPVEAVEEPPKVSRAAIAAAKEDLATLQAEKAKRQAILADCAEYISELRTKLQIAEAEWTVLPCVETAGLSPEVLAAYNVELERLEQIKAKTLGPLLEAARARLRPLWVQLHLSEAETKECTAAWPAGGSGEAESTEDTEQLEEALEAVEEEEKRLQGKLEQVGRVLQLMAKRETILEQRAEMIANQKDPSRLLNRRDPGRLLREEKLRVAVEKDLPKMNKKLRELAAEWSSAHGNGGPLTYDGVAICELLDTQETEDAREKAEEKRRKEEEAAAKKAEKEAGKAGGMAKPAPRISKSAAPSKAGGGPAGAAPKGAAAFKAAAKLGAFGSAAATAAAAPPPPPPEEEPASAEQGRPALAAAAGNAADPAFASPPTKGNSAATAVGATENLPVVN